MKIGFLMTSPPPPIPDTDAVFQEAEQLAARFGGDLLGLFPLQHPSVFVPPFLFGIHCRGRRAEWNEAYDAFHVYHPIPRVFPFLRGLTKPVIYSVTAGVPPRLSARSVAVLKNLRAIVVSNERDLATLESHGLKNVRRILPGIDTTLFRDVPPPPATGPFTLLAGSAPWTRAQFRTKGFDTLLLAVKNMPDLQLVLLWRGLLERELDQRIRTLGIADRVVVVRKHTDVAQVLANVHAAVVLAEMPKLVKAYPHSLLEALAAGRPVLVSECIPMADLVRRESCGLGVTGDFSAALRTFRADYARLQPNARPAVEHSFSLPAFFQSYESLYGEIG
jgi:glycosyltransferase involved in cell wall biosynthesis